MSTSELTKISAALSDLNGRFSTLQSDLEEKLENASDKWLESDAGTATQDKLDHVVNIVQYLDDIETEISYLT